jgi:hypothetical protein
MDYGMWRVQVWIRNVEGACMDLVMWRMHAWIRVCGGCMHGLGYVEGTGMD